MSQEIKRIIKIGDQLVGLAKSPFNNPDEFGAYVLHVENGVYWWKQLQHGGVPCSTNVKVAPDEIRKFLEDRD